MIWGAHYPSDIFRVGRRPGKAGVANLCSTMNFICGPARESSGCDENAAVLRLLGSSPCPLRGQHHVVFVLLPWLHSWPVDSAQKGNGTQEEIRSGSTFLY